MKKLKPTEDMSIHLGVVGFQCQEPWTPVHEVVVPQVTATFALRVSDRLIETEGLVFSDEEILDAAGHLAALIQNKIAGMFGTPEELDGPTIPEGIGRRGI